MSGEDVGNKPCPVKDSDQCQTIKDSWVKIKDYKDLIRTIQKEADKCQGELKDTKSKLNTGYEDYKTLSNQLNDEKNLSSKLMGDIKELHMKLNASMQEVNLWANQYFTFMQSTIKGSAMAMTQPPVAPPIGGGMVKK